MPPRPSASRSSPASSAPFDPVPMITDLLQKTCPSVLDEHLETFTHVLIVARRRRTDDHGLQPGFPEAPRDFRKADRGEPEGLPRTGEPEGLLQPPGRGPSKASLEPAGKRKRREPPHLRCVQDGRGLRPLRRAGPARRERDRHRHFRPERPAHKPDTGPAQGQFRAEGDCQPSEEDRGGPPGFPPVPRSGKPLYRDGATAQGIRVTGQGSVRV